MFEIVKAYSTYLFKLIKVTIFRKKYVLSRTACLGNDIQSKVIANDVTRINFQKSRVDRIIEEKKTYSPIFSLKNLVPRQDIRNIIHLQAIDFFNINKKPELVILDSYSELTDQKFIVGENKQYFYSNYSDVNKNEIRGISCCGLLDLINIEKHYEGLFRKIQEKYGSDTPIIFIHFSTALEDRQKFIERSNHIFNAIESIKNNKRYNLYNVYLEDNAIKPNSNDSFNYHFSNETKESYSNVVREKLREIKPNLII
ncbi:hypothetical protein ACWX0P_10445 [Vibrio mediterranei]